MARAFDATTKHLIESHPADWLAFAGLPVSASVRVVDADLSSFTLAADKVIYVDGLLPYIAHFEFQSGVDVDLDSRVLLYNVVLRWRHRVPVRSVIILLRPGADSSAVTGAVSDNQWPQNRLDFAYKIIRVWELSPEALLAGGAGTVPLAPISAVGKDDLERTIEKLQRRLEDEPPADSRELEAAALILLACDIRGLSLTISFEEPGR